MLKRCELSMVIYCHLSFILHDTRHELIYMFHSIEHIFWPNLWYASMIDTILFIVKLFQKTFKIMLIYVLRRHAECDNSTCVLTKSQCGWISSFEWKEQFFILNSQPFPVMYPFECLSILLLLGKSTMRQTLIETRALNIQNWFLIAIGYGINK